MATKAAKVDSILAKGNMGYPSGYDAKFATDRYYKHLPDFNESLQRHVKGARPVRVHAESDCFPYEIFAFKSPEPTPGRMGVPKGAVRANHEHRVEQSL